MNKKSNPGKIHGNHCSKIICKTILMFSMCLCGLKKKLNHNPYRLIRYRNIGSHRARTPIMNKKRIREKPLNLIDFREPVFRPYLIPKVRILHR